MEDQTLPIRQNSGQFIFRIFVPSRCPESGSRYRRVDPEFRRCLSEREGLNRKSIRILPDPKLFWGREISLVFPQAFAMIFLKVSSAFICVNQRPMKSDALIKSHYADSFDCRGVRPDAHDRASAARPYMPDAQKLRSEAHNQVRRNDSPR